MGTSHQRSNLVGLDGTETIRGFATVSATAIIGTTGAFTTLTGDLTGDLAGGVTGDVTGDLTGSVDGNKIKCTSYIQLGAEQYIFFGAETTEASILAAATLLSMAGDAANATLIGSLYVGTDGYLWIFDANTTATKLTRN